jgi:hypothetical protein
VKGGIYRGINRGYGFRKDEANTDREHTPTPSFRVETVRKRGVVERCVRTAEKGRGDREKPRTVEV